MGRLGLLESLAQGESLLGNSGLYTSMAFQALLRHERYRADRDGKEFALVVFELNSARPRNGDIKKVFVHIKGEMRSIDEIGWFDQNSVGVLLPATKTEGGKAFAGRVLKNVPRGEVLPFKVFSYPDNWLAQIQKIRPAANCEVRESSEGRGVTLSAEKTIQLEPKAVFENAFCPKMPLWKKALDLVGSLLGVVFLSPVMILLALYIRTVSPGPVLFRQQRVGRGGRIFTFLKFRRWNAITTRTTTRTTLLPQ